MAISETGENENFGKKRLTYGLSLQNLLEAEIYNLQITNYQQKLLESNAAAEPIVGGDDAPPNKYKFMVIIIYF